MVAEAILEVSVGHLGTMQSHFGPTEGYCGKPLGHVVALGSHLGHLGCHLRIIMQCRSQNVDFPNGF